MKRAIATIAVGLAATLLRLGGVGPGDPQQRQAEGLPRPAARTPALAGFGVPDAQGNWTGLDVDFCRAIAAAIFNDPTKVRFIPLSAKDRFTALQSGEVDVLVRNTTWTMSRDTQLGLDFTGVNYYDGQGFMVRKKLGVTSAKELNGASVCTQQGTTTELNLADFFRANNMKYEVVAFATADETFKAYDAGRCDAFTTDASGLYAERLQGCEPGRAHRPAGDHLEGAARPVRPPRRRPVGRHRALDPLRHGQRRGARRHQGQCRPDDEVDNPEIKRLLGTEGKFGEAIGLTNDWAFRIIKHVGNYGEIFERNVGQGSPLKIQRGQNALWTKGGLQYAPPIR